MNKKLKAIAILPLFALVGCEAASQSVHAKETYVHFEKQVNANYLTTANKRVTSTSGTYTTASDTSFFIVDKAVKEGERYLANFKISKTGYVAYAFTNEKNQVIYSYKSNTDNYGANEYYSCSITVPDRAVQMHINCDKSYESNFSIKQLVISEEALSDVDTYNIDKEEIVFGANNIGEFDYGNTDFTTAEYKTHWTTMLKANKYDFFSFEDLRSTYLDGSATKNLLGSEGNYWNALPSYGEFFALSSQAKPISSAIVPLPYSTGGKSSKRFIALRNTYLINKKLTALYTVHLVAEGHISTSLKAKDGSTVYYLSQQLRQNQFQTIIKDTKAYDAAVIMGDFNCQKADEYQSWLNAGFNIGNGSKEYGEILTLIRDPNGADKDKPSIPADNIITTGNLTIKTGTFKKLDGYNLNTDHRPVMATVLFGE